MRAQMGAAAAQRLLTLLVLIATLAHVPLGSRVDQELDGGELQLTPDAGEELAETTEEPCDAVGGSVQVEETCQCPSDKMKVMCIGDDGKPQATLLDHTVEVAAVAGKTCTCVEQVPKPKQRATKVIKGSTCSEDIVDCIYHILPKSLRHLSTNLHKLLWWDMSGSVNYDTLPKYYLSRSKGNRYEIAYRGATLITLSQEAVTSSLLDLVNRPGTGEKGQLRVQGYKLQGWIFRKSELGNMAMGNVGQFYSRFGGIGLGAPSSIHDSIRPLVQKLYGTKAGEFESTEYTGFNGKGDGNYWTDAALLESARQYLASAERLDYSTPYCHWAIREYHKIVGIDAEILAASETGITDEVEYAKKLCKVQGTIVVASAVPWVVAKILKATSKDLGPAIKWRQQVTKDYKKAVMKKLNLADGQVVADIAGSIVDAHLFAGGLSVPNFIASCVAVIYRKGTRLAMAGGGQGDLGQDFSITDFVWEVSRLMSPVHFVPMWYRNKGTGGMFGSTREKVLACTACAQYDPRVWEPEMASTNFQAAFTEATKFKIRPTQDYETNSIGWADVAHNPEKPERDRWCPGKRLSLSLTVAWLTAFLEVADKWSVETPHTWKAQHLSPYVKPFNLVKTG